MSYARSPRPLCSITIGMRPSPRGSSALLSLMVCSFTLPSQFAAARAVRDRSRRRRLHQREERRRLVLHIRPLKRPVDDVAFDRPHFVFVQPLRLLVMPADHRVGLLEALRRFLDERAYLLGARVQLMLPH